MKSYRSLRIVLADQQESARVALRRLLESAGHEVTSAVNSADLLLACAFEPPEVFILDLNLPDGDGFDLCDQIRRGCGESEPTIIITTARHDDMTRAYLHQMVAFAGGDYYFTKPFDGKLLLALLDEIAERDTESIRRGNTLSFPTRVIWPTARQYQHHTALTR